MTHLLKLLDKMYKYEKDPTRNVGATERTQDAGQTDGWSETNIPPNNFVVLRAAQEAAPMRNEWPL